MCTYIDHTCKHMCLCVSDMNGSKDTRSERKEVGLRRYDEPLALPVTQSSVT